MKLKVTVIILALFVLIVFYYSIEIINARSHTVEFARIYMRTVKIHKNDLSNDQIKILLKIEDPNFYKHDGIDFKTPGSGWTTITESLAKYFYFNNFKQGLSKIKQILCAKFALNPLVSKDDQITLYLNIMYFGNNQYGLVDAAQYYFSKKVSNLSRDEYISLIGSLISPTQLNINNNPKGNLERVNKIKKLLSGEYKPKNIFDITYDK